MRSPARLCVIITSAVLALAGLAGCDPKTGRAGGEVHCNVSIDAPTRDDPHSPKKIVSQVRYWCESPGASKLALTLRMQKQNAKGDWVDVVKSAFVVSGTKTVPTGDSRYRTHTVSVSCAEGSYRTTVKGAASGKNTKAMSYDMTGGRSVNPCTASFPL